MLARVEILTIKWIESSKAPTNKLTFKLLFTLFIFSQIGQNKIYIILQTNKSKLKKICYLIIVLTVPSVIKMHKYTILI